MMSKSMTGWKPVSSPGLKLLLVCFLALMMTIPAMFVFGISFERSSRAINTRNEIGQAAGGAQTVIGPILAVPIEISDASGIWSRSDTLLIFANKGTIQADLTVTTRKKSLYAVQVYESNLQFEAQFDLKILQQFSSNNQQFKLDQAQILVGVSDLRGALDDAWLTTGTGKRRKFTPFSGDLVLRGEQAVSANRRRTTMGNEYGGFTPRLGQALSVSVGEDMGQDILDIHVSMVLGGAQNMTLVPFARSTHLNMAADWPHPGFGGDYLPTTREITEDGFSASRTVPALASGLPPFSMSSQFAGWDRLQRGMNVALVDKASPYQYVSRALKYALMFIGFVFLTFFLFEMNSKTPVHAAQYVLVGLAQTVFYLLLLALSEHVGFDLAFFIAAGLIIGLTGFYAGAVFGKDRMIPALAVFGAVYGLLFILMRLEDYALVVGAFASFGAIATTMWMTRNMKWYGKNPEGDD